MIVDLSVFLTLMRRSLRISETYKKYCVARGAASGKREKSTQGKEPKR